MANAALPLTTGQPRIVGSFGSAADLSKMIAAEASRQCDIAEIRLDLLSGPDGQSDAGSWSHLAGMPLLFTARRHEEGGALPLGDRDRMAMLEAVLDQAALVDIEVASIAGMAEFIATLKTRGIPWIASFHDFGKVPERSVLEDAAGRALASGAAAFKLAAMLEGPQDLAKLADFQLADHGLPVATMGMGPLAPVSRLLCAQCGSVLNYGYLGANPTAPGQWDAARLKQAVARLLPFRA